MVEDGPRRVAYSTIRALRSAASQFCRLDMIFNHPDKVYLDSQRRALQVAGVCPTDSLESTLFQKGFAARNGTESKPSTALQFRHVQYLDASLRVKLGSASSRAHKLEIARAGLANSIFWLGWLRSNEGFSLRFGNVKKTRPGDGASLGLPPSMGCLQLELLEQTKSSRSTTADVVMSWVSTMGISPGFWYETVERLLEVPAAPDALIFVHANGTRWDSTYFRHTYLIPSLNEQRLAGDPLLRMYDGSPGNSLAETFYSMYSYRRGARTHVQRSKNGARRKATKMEVFEHGR